MEVTVPLPDLKGRKEIIELYISKIKKDSDVDVDKLAKGTTGFSGEICQHSEISHVVQSLLMVVNCEIKVEPVLIYIQIASNTSSC